MAFHIKLGDEGCSYLVIVLALSSGGLAHIDVKQLDSQLYLSKQGGYIVTTVVSDVIISLGLCRALLSWDHSMVYTWGRRTLQQTISVERTKLFPGSGPFILGPLMRSAENEEDQCSLFATSRNPKFLIHGSLFPDPIAWDEDAFQHY